ncbi:MAG: molybdopterin guanine dinucleotide-containing S/N-oxide reductase [Helicobacter sp.]|nr:molybdopterin guanine dinucleotide-containing S/N-oxide reductase [Helicobacter sp.]
MAKSTIKRRTILKGLALFAAIPFADSLGLRSALFAQESKFNFELIKEGEVISGAHWGILKITLKEGKIIKSENAIKTSIINPLQSVTADLVYTPSRVRYPMVRKSFLENPNSPKPELRGKEEWVRVDYKTAIKLIADALKRTYKDKGASGVFAGSYGWKSSGNMHNARILLHRFMGMAGGYVGSTGDYSTGASQVILPYVVGTIEVYEQQTSWKLVLEHSKVVVIWGANPYNTLRIAWSITDSKGLEYLEELKKAGKKLIFIDPVKNDTCEYLGAEWIAPVPNTDVALMLGIAHTMLTTQKYDKEFLETYTEGFEQFKDYLLGKEDGVVKNSKWAAKITGVSEKKIKNLAKLFYENRTMLLSGWGMQRAHHGEQPHWMLVTLASMIGQIGLPGGGFGLSYHYSNGGSPTTNAPVIGGMNIGTASEGAEWLQGSGNNAIPVARVADMLLNPGKTIDNNGKKITYSDIDFVYWCGGNPIVHHQDTNQMLQAWRKPKTIVVNEPYWTPTARMADIVMPITTPYERNDISMSGDYSNLNIVPMKQVVAKEFESVDDYQVFSDLAKEFGIYDKYTENKTEMQWIEEFYNLAFKQAQAQNKVFAGAIEMPSFEEFWSKNQPLTFNPTLDGENFVRYADFREDPILNPLGTPSGKIEIYSQAIEQMQYEDCKAHPTWFEPIEWLGMQNKPAEFAMITAHPPLRLHSQLANTSLRDSYAINGREPIWIHPQDAKAKGIKDGDIVRVFNARGEILAGAKVTNRVKKGVVNLCEGAWYDPDDANKSKPLCCNGSANVLTLDIPTSKLANGNISHTLLVNIEKYKGEAPKLKVFEQPQIKA